MLSGCGGAFLWGGQILQIKCLGCAGDVDLGSACGGAVGSHGDLLVNLHGIQPGLGWRGLQSSSHPTPCHGTPSTGPGCSKPHSRLAGGTKGSRAGISLPLHIDLSPLVLDRGPPWGLGAVGASLASLSPPSISCVCSALTSQGFAV